jgi:Tfp pilus assembly protein PilO
MILPLSPDVSNFTNQIVGVAQQNGLTISSIGIQKASSLSSNVSAINPVAVLRADLQVTGTYAAIKGFVQGIENNFLLMDVTDINLAYASSGQPGAAPLSGTISIASYYQTVSH